MGDGTRLGLVLRELDPRRWVFGNRLMSRNGAPNGMNSWILHGANGVMRSSKYVVTERANNG